jgi:hypothetical protein
MKLTPATIKRIIAEERQKIEKEEEVIILEGKKKLLEKLRLLKKIKNKQMNSLNEAKELHNLKKKLIKSIKGDK